MHQALCVDPSQLYVAGMGYIKVSDGVAVDVSYTEILAVAGKAVNPVLEMPYI